MTVTALPTPRQALLASGRPAWQVGHLAGLSPTVLSHISTGRRDPRPEEAARLAVALGLAVSDLFPESEREAA
jgi:hypothetical protein